MLKKIIIILNNFYTYSLNILYLTQLNIVRYYNSKGKYLIPKLKRKIRRRLKRTWKNLNNHKKFYKYLPFWFILAKINPTPSRLIKWFMLFVFNFGCFIRSSFYLLYYYDYLNINFYFFLKINFFLFFFLKLIQEVYYNFTCPLATFLYGKMVRRERKWKDKLKEKEAKKKLHKFVANPFYTKAEKIKIQAEKDKQSAIREAKHLKNLINRRSKWKELKKSYVIWSIFKKNLKKKKK